jgi:integrase
VKGRRLVCVDGTVRMPPDERLMRLMAGHRLGYAAQQMRHTVDMFVHTYRRWINDGHSAQADQKLEQLLVLETPEVTAIGGVR